jgi:phospholipid transport system substrate-binding protein
MKQLFTRAALFGMFMLVALNVWAVVEVADAQALVKNTTNEVLETLQADSSKVYKLVDKVVLPHFDFKKMSKLVLGKQKVLAGPP